MSLPARLLGANPSIQVSTLLSGSLSTPSAKQAFIPPVYYEIGSFTGDGTTSSVTYSNLPTTYRNIEIRGQFAASGATSYIFLRINGSTTGYYYDRARTGDGTTNQTMNTQTNDSGADIARNNTASPTSYRNTFSITIPSYNTSLSRLRTAIGMSGMATGGTSSDRQFIHWGQNSTTAVTSITIYNFTAFDTKTQWTVWAY